MRVTTIHAARDIRLEDRPVPVLEEPTDAIVRVSASCICGSDLWSYRGENSIEPGSPIGHEIVGVVEEVGSEVRSFRPGDFVVAPFVHCDNSCAHCRAGITSACRNQGFTVGGQGEYVRVHQAEGSLVKTEGMPDEAMVVTVPVCEAAPYQAIQIGSRWYISTDYEHHQTSLTRAQSQADPDGRLRYVVSERDPGIANWLETCGHPQGVMMLRWQRLARDLTAADGPAAEVVPFDEVPSHLPFYESNRVTAEEYAARIEARQVGIARRMIS